MTVRRHSDEDRPGPVVTHGELAAATVTAVAVHAAAAVVALAHRRVATAVVVMAIVVRALLDPLCFIA